jgi:hypothetical protein
MIAGRWFTNNTHTHVVSPGTPLRKKAMKDIQFSVNPTKTAKLQALEVD